jgi:hypothetical protein
MGTYNEEEIKKALDEVESALKNFGKKYIDACKKFKNLKSMIAEKTIPPISLSEGFNLQYSPFTDPPQRIKVDNVSLAILAIGEMLLDFGNSSSGVGFEEIDSLYKSLPVGYQIQLRPVYEALQHELSVKTAKMEKERSQTH